MLYAKMLRVLVVGLVMLVGTSALASSIKTGTITSSYGTDLVYALNQTITVGGTEIQIGQASNLSISNDQLYLYTLPNGASNFTFTTAQSFTNIQQIGVFVMDPACSSGGGFNCSFPAETLNVSCTPTCNVSGFGVSDVLNPNGTVTFTVGSASASDDLTLFVLTASTPEPGTVLLLGSGLVGIVGAARRKFRL